MSPRRIAIVLAAIASLAQSQTFEVASIKPSGPQSIRGSEGGPGTSGPVRYRFASASLQDLIAVAYDVRHDLQISSQTPLDRQHFDLEVKLPEGATKPQFRSMLQNLLAERFSLKLHTQSREFPAYELVIAKTGPKLQDAKAHRSTVGEGFPDLPPNRPGMISRNSKSGSFFLVQIRSQEEPISVLAGMLRPADGLPVVDKTGLPGKYDFTLEYTMEPPNASSDGLADPPTAPSMFTALQQQLGLQLVRKKLPFDVLVIDSFSKLPVEN